MQCDKLERNEIIKTALENRGGIVQTMSLMDSIQISNEFAPEHLSLMIKNPLDIIPQIKNAGGIFVGENSFEVLGDYIAGPSHVMPTSGSARFSSPLSVIDFVKISSFIYLDKEQSRFLSKYAEIFARNEKLDGHANAVNQRIKNNGGV